MMFTKTQLFRLRFIDEKKSVLVGDQSFMIYKETDKPKLSKTVKLDKQIKKLFP